MGIHSDPCDVSFIVLLGRKTDTNAAIFFHSYHDVIVTHPGMEMVAQQSANRSQTEAFDVIENLIQAHPDVKGVISGNDTMAMDAIVVFADSDYPVYSSTLQPGIA